MKIGTLYKKVVEIGIQNDLRKREEITKILKEEKEAYKKLKNEEAEFYDKDRLFNPFSDTRVLHGDLDTEVKKMIIGIDMEVGEILLTYLMNKDLDQKIDLIISHHPEGYALARLHEVMKLQADLLANYGITISVAEQLMEKRISEIERRLMPVNHNRAVDVAKILGIPMMCIHTPADNCVTNYLKKTFEKTGGTEGSKDIFEKYATSGVSTLVCMHLSEDHLKNAKKANLNAVIAGHIASDNLGLNLLFDKLEKEEKLKFVNVSGFERIRRTK